MRRKAVALGLIAVLCIAGFLLLRDSSSKRILSDGTELVLSGVMVGHTNVYWHGTKLSKVLGRLAPSNGITVAGLKLQRPQRDGRNPRELPGRIHPAAKVRAQAKALTTNLVKQQLSR